MDRDWSKRRAALHARAEEAMRAALAAAEKRAPFQAAVVADVMEAVGLACWDPVLDPGDAIALIDEALRLMPSLKELARAAGAAPPALIVEVLRRTGGLLRRHARLVQAKRARLIGHDLRWQAMIESASYRVIG